MTEPRPTSLTVFQRIVRRPVTLLVLFVTLMLVGLISYQRIPVQMMPGGISYPGLWAWVVNPGASAPENEEQVARPLEEQLRTLPGYEEIQSRSRENSVNLFVEFQSDTDMDVAKAELRDRIERTRPQLPDTIEEIGVWSWSPDQMPIMWMSILHDGQSDRVDYLMETVVQRKLENVEGVGRVETHGLLGDSVRILLDEERVLAANLDLGALIRRLSADNFAMPMGEVEDGGRRYLLRADMRFRSLEEIERYPVGNGLVLADLAEVIRAKSVRERLFRIDGAYAFYVEIQKESQANTVATSYRVLDAIEELENDPRIGGELGFLVLFNQGEFIENSLDQLRSTAMWGGAFALLVLLLFLRRLRLTICVALSIPISALLAIAWTYFSGGTFNVLTMTGITLAIGMLVDNSVVVIENIARVRALGRSPNEAAAEGAADVGLAVLLATLTTVVVFLPLIFMTDNPTVRVMFGALGFPLCIALVFSLLVALVFLPVAAGRIVGPRHPRVQRVADALAPVGRLPARLIAQPIGVLRVLLHQAVRGIHAVMRPLLAVLAPLRWLLAIVLVGAVVWRFQSLAETARVARPYFEASSRSMPMGLFGGGLVLAALLGLTVLLFLVRRWRRRSPVAPVRPATFVPAGNSILDFAIAGNRALLEWSMRHRVLASVCAVGALVSVVIPRSMMEVTAFGEDDDSSEIDLYVDLEENFTLAQASEEFGVYESWLEEQQDTYGFEHIGTRFDDEDGRVSLYWETTQPLEYLEWVRKDLRERIPRLPGHKLRYRGEDEGATRRRNLVFFHLRGSDSGELERIAGRAVDVLEAIPGLSSVSSSVETAPKQVRIVFDDSLSERMGVTPNAALQNISWALRGWQLPRIQEPGREVPLILEYDEEQIAGLDTLRDLQIWTGDSVVPLASVASLEFGRGSQSIQRLNGEANVTLTGRVDDPSQQQRITREGHAALAHLDLPRGYYVGMEDSAMQRQEEETRELLAALMLSVVLVFLLMGILFESFILPFSVLFTIPFAVVGALWTLFLTGTTMDSIGWIGIIILVGVVVNNGIVLIDRVHRLRGEGMERSRAVVEGCGQRVRPVLMTALTTIFGLLPMAVSTPPGQGIDYRALATCVAGGLACSTFFTLWVVPLAYTVLDDLGRIGVARTSWALRPLRRVLVAES